MDIVQFIEKIFDIKLLNYQKKMIEYMDTHPDCKIIFPRGRFTPVWYYMYIMCKAIGTENNSMLDKEEENKT